MGAESPRIAFFGAMSLFAKEVRSVLESRAIASETVKLYDAKQEGTVTEFAGEALLVTKPDEEEAAGLDIAFLCGTAAETVPYLDWPARRGYVAIDLTGASRDRAGVPIVHNEINPEAISGADGALRPIIAAPHPVSHNLASIVAGLRGAGTVTHVEALALRPASDLGDSGIDELYQQTIALLNFSSVPQEVFGRQLAFNILPSTGVDTSRAESFDERIRDETVRVLDMRPDQLSVASAFVSMFHGHAIAATVNFDKAPNPAALKDSMLAFRGITLQEDPSLGSPAEVAGEDNLAVVGLRPDARRPAMVRLWSFCDNLRSGAALNAVRIAERVLDSRRAGR
jgi:aspartate-semialdehyde dehydrogenase